MVKDVFAEIERGIDGVVEGDRGSKEPFFPFLFFFFLFFSFSLFELVKPQLRLLSLRFGRFTVIVYFLEW